MIWTFLLLGAVRYPGFDEFANLTNLHQLVLGGNRLTGEVPIELAELANLEELILDGNRLTGPVPRGLRDILEA